MTKAGYLEWTRLPVTVPFPLEAVFTEEVSDIGGGEVILAVVCLGEPIRSGYAPKHY